MFFLKLLSVLLFFDRNANESIRGIFKNINCKNIFQEQERREREERLESLRQRKATVHKPRPVPNLAAPPQDIQPSEKPLTVPKTPKFR